MNQNTFKKDDLFLLAVMSQQTQRYEQMVDYIQKIVKLDLELSSSQRNIVSSAYKNVVGNRRAQLRALSALQHKYSKQQYQHKQSLWIKSYKTIIEKQLIKYCKGVIALLEEHLLANVKSIDSKVFYLKMKGDYYRYLCEDGERENDLYQQRAKMAYHQADNYARNNLASTNPIRLSLNLNMSVFYYEIQHQHQKALEIANRAFEDGIGNIDNVNEENYKDCTLILQLLRDNITLWSSDVPEQEL